MKVILLLIAAGIISTLVMDLGAALFRMTGLTAGAPPEFIGKWIHSAISGQVFVDDIRTSAGNPVPLPTFLLYHYIIGVTLTFVFYLLILLFKISPLPWWAPLVFGIGTTIIPAFLMFPGMGFGLLGLKGPAEYLLLRTALINHLFYGIGLLLAFRLLYKPMWSAG